MQPFTKLIILFFQLGYLLGGVLIGNGAALLTKYLWVMYQPPRRRLPVKEVSMIVEVISIVVYIGLALLTIWMYIRMMRRRGPWERFGMRDQIWKLLSTVCVVAGIACGIAIATF